ncbi:MAG: hypothetical protein H7A53_09695 [Akkermansiaceae bacterium]|nr:hypothetical protein [Akkermansiaceae bacterium]MCP5551150.1 hypothetical protein [Akkermansiaceae bacterium]
MDYQNNPNHDEDHGNLRVLAAAAADPEAAYESSGAVREAFDDELRRLAEEIVAHHPSLTQLLLSFGGSSVQNPVHGRN